MPGRTQAERPGTRPGRWEGRAHQHQQRPGGVRCAGEEQVVPLQGGGGLRSGFGRALLGGAAAASFGHRPGYR